MERLEVKKGCYRNICGAVEECFIQSISDCMFVNIYGIANAQECFYYRWKVACSSFSPAHASLHFRIILLKGFISVRFMHKLKWL